MAELVDALASGASVRKNVEVQVLFRPPLDAANKFALLVVNHSAHRVTSRVGEGPNYLTS